MVVLGSRCGRRVVPDWARVAEEGLCDQVRLDDNDPSGPIDHASEGRYDDDNPSDDDNDVHLAANNDHHSPADDNDDGTATTSTGHASTRSCRCDRLLSNYERRQLLQGWRTLSCSRPRNVRREWHWRGDHVPKQQRLAVGAKLSKLPPGEAMMQHNYMPHSCR